MYVKEDKRFIFHWKRLTSKVTKKFRFEQKPVFVIATSFSGEITGSRSSYNSREILVWELSTEIEKFSASLRAIRIWLTCLSKAGNQSALSNEFEHPPEWAVPKPEMEASYFVFTRWLILNYSSRIYCCNVLLRS